MLPCPQHGTANGTEGGQQHPLLTLQLTKLLISPHLSAAERSARREVKAVRKQAVVFPKRQPGPPILTDTAWSGCAAPCSHPLIDELSPFFRSLPHDQKAGFVLI